MGSCVERGVTMPDVCFECCRRGWTWGGCPNWKAEAGCWKFGFDEPCGEVDDGHGCKAPCPRCQGSGYDPESDRYRTEANYIASVSPTCAALVDAIGGFLLDGETAVVSE